MAGASDAFGGLLRHYRLAAGLSQDALAEAAGLSKRGISDLERGRRRAPYPTTVRRLADALNLDEPGRARLFAARDTRPAGEDVQPPASTQHTHLLELPRELTSFIGREHELRELARRLAESGLVTIAGPGGAGKTRLALRLAHHLLDQSAFADGVVLVDLAPLSEPALVVETVAESVGTPEPHGVPSVEVLTRFLRTRQLLLVLDNCEHLLDACADVASRVLRSCPGAEAARRRPARITRRLRGRAIVHPTRESRGLTIRA
jgi:transcriptional regulator with XRE-family HTH domain